MCNNKYFLLALSIGTMASTSILTSCSDDKNTTISKTEKAVKVFPILETEVVDTAEWIGYLRGIEDTDLYPRVSGTLEYYVEGKTVKGPRKNAETGEIIPGEIIYKIDAKPFEAELARALANLAETEATLQQAKASKQKWEADVKRYQESAKSGAIADKNRDDAEYALAGTDAQIKSLQAEILRQQAAVKIAEINLGYTTVRAPYDGRVGTSLVSKGELVSPATKLGNIISIGHVGNEIPVENAEAATPFLRVEIAINSDALTEDFRLFGNVQSDKQNPKLDQLKTYFTLILEDGTEYPIQGTLVSMDSRIDDTGLINIIGHIENDGRLRGGMKANVKVNLERTRRQALLVPPDAIRSIMRNKFIVFVDKDNIPHSIPVSIDGEYEVDVKDASGTTTRQKMIAISDYPGRPLWEEFKKYKLKTPADVKVVADADDGAVAMNISAANSRLEARRQELEKAYNEQQNSIWSNICVAVGLEDKVEPPDSIKPTALTTQDFSFTPQTATPAAKQTEKINQNAQPTLPPIPVKTAKLLQQDVHVQVDWYGIVRGKEEAQIRPQINGFLIEQNFRNGTIVEGGHLLYRIDPAPYDAALAQAQANLESAKARHEAAKVDHEKSRKDLERLTNANKETPGTVKAKEITDAECNLLSTSAAIKQAEAEVQQMEAALKTAQINKEYTEIKAPFKGRVGISKVSIGDLVSQTDTQPLVTLSSTDDMRVDFQVSGKDALKITGQIGQSPHQPSLVFDIILEDGTTYPGKVVSADNVVKKSTGTFGIVANIENAGGALRSGMPVTVRGKLQQEQGAFLVPARAPISGAQDIIILVGPDGAPTPLPIQKGAIVTIPVETEADGKKVMLEQPMQIIRFNPDMLSQMGFKDPAKVQVVVEGTTMADMAMKANMKANGRANKLSPTPFIYTKPKTVEPSVTAEKANTASHKKF